MKIRLNVLVILALMISVSGCDFDLVVEVDIPESEKKLVVNSLFSPQYEWQLVLTESSPITNPGDMLPVPDQIIRLYEDGEFIGIFDWKTYEPNIYDVTPMSRYVMSDFIPQAGKKYSIQIDADEYPEVSAENSIPSAPEFSLVSVEPRYREIVNYDWVSHYGRIIFTITDQAAATDYYSVYVSRYNRELGYDEETEEYYIKPDTAYSHISFFTDDAVIKQNEQTFFDEGSSEDLAYFNGEAVFSDDLFNGSTRQFAIQVFGEDIERNDPNEAQAKLCIRRISKAWFDYALSRKLQGFNMDNPFAEPVSVFNNIENGLGIFAGFNEKCVYIN